MTPSQRQLPLVELDLDRYELRVEGSRVRLERKSMELLTLLAERPGELVTREQIAERLWGNSTFIDIEHGINTAVRKARKALRDRASRPTFLETVVGKGYRLAGPVRILSSRQPIQASGAASAAKAALGTLAVFPFENHSGDPELQFLSEGLTDSLIRNLSRHGQLRVLARTTVARIPQGTDPLEGARSLNANLALTGSVSQQKGVLLVAAELVEISTGTHMWGAHYRRQAADLVAVQDSIGREVAEALQLRLAPAGGSLPRPAAPSEAYRLYLRGRHQWNQWTAEGQRRAIEYFTQAIELAPDFAIAYAGLAEVYAVPELCRSLGLSSSQAFTAAKENALRALEIDSAVAEAHTALALVKFSFEWDWLAAEREFQRALELNPSSADTCHWYAHLLVVLKRMDEAYQLGRRAAELNPLDPEMGVHAGWHSIHAGDFARAVEHCRAALELDRHFYEIHQTLGIAHCLLGNFEESIRCFERAIQLSGGFRTGIAGLAHVLGRAGQADRARECIAELQRHKADPWYLAIAYAGLDDCDSAVGALERAYSAKSAWMPYLQSERRLSGMWSHPRVQELSRAMRLP